MAEEHWFDVFSKAAVHATTRRGVARSAAVLLPSLLLSGEAEVAADKKKGGKKKGSGGRSGKKEKGKKEKRKKDKGRKEAPNLMGSPSPWDDCIYSFPELPEMQNTCLEIRESCQWPDNFCVYVNDWNAMTWSVACCPHPKECCSDGCVDKQNDRNNCGRCDRNCVDPDEVCDNGRCINAFCAGGIGDPPFDTWTQYCEGRCIPADALCCDDSGCAGYDCCPVDDSWWCGYSTGPNANNPRHCGGCNVRCPGNQSCTAGTCGCQEGSGTYWCPTQEWCIHASYPC